MGEVAERLREWRKQNGYTLKNVAESVGTYLGGPVSPNTVGNYERRRGPTLPFLVALAKAYSRYELDLRWLLTGTSQTEIKGKVDLGADAPDEVTRWMDGREFRLVMDVGGRAR